MVHRRPCPRLAERTARVLMGSYVVAVVIYLLVHKGVTSALRLFAGQAKE